MRRSAGRAASLAREGIAQAPEVPGLKPERSVPPDSNMAAPFVYSEVLSLALSGP